MGRGFNYGARPDDPDRIVFSSILNAAPLCRKCHEEKPFSRAELLANIEAKVRSSGYEMREKDERFMEYFDGDLTI